METRAMNNQHRLKELAKYIRYLILVSTTQAGSGHPTSSMSAADLMTGLVFGGTFRFDVNRPEHPNNDRLIFSKGHASPLLYAIWVLAGKITEAEMMRLRKFESPLEGHPTAAFRYAEAATGSLGQGLSIGFGIALNAKYLDKLPYRTYVLLGDSEMSEGSQWEAIQLAVHYQLDNLVGIIDVNRLGQRGETMFGHDLRAYEQRLLAFGWEPIIIDGHNLEEINRAFERALQVKDKPVMIIAKTIKGKGVSFLEDRNGLHGKPVSHEDLPRALRELGEVIKTASAEISKPEELSPQIFPKREIDPIAYEAGSRIATRKAYGNALNRIAPGYPQLVALDAEVSNSTYSEILKNNHPDRFFEMYIAEQNMVGAAQGLSSRNKIPFVSTFAAFMTRAFDQIRMSQYSDANIKFCGSHAGVSIGEDGPSQMGLEDIAMFRTVHNCVVLYPCDAVSTEKLVEQAAKHRGITYLRTTRSATPIIYDPEEEFPFGGCKILRQSDGDRVTVVAAGITLHEALAAYRELKEEGVLIRVVDLYCIKPIDRSTLADAVRQTRAIITVEDHFAEGGIGEAVAGTLGTHPIPVYSMAVRKVPRSGSPDQLLEFEDISKNAIVHEIRKILQE
jgi:transketolase